MDSILRFDNKASEWIDGLPFGNGRICGMLWGDDGKDIISLNHESIWTGFYKDRECEKTDPALLPIVRRYLDEDQIFKATALSAVAFGGNGGISPLFRRVDSYQPACDVVLEREDRLVERTLDMATGIACNAGDRVRLDAFASLMDDCFAFRWSSDEVFSGKLYLDREQTEDAVLGFESSQDGLILNADLGPGVSFKVRLQCVSDGDVTVLDDRTLHIEGARNLYCLADIGTSMKGIDKELGSPLDVRRISWDFLIQRQEKEFSSIMNRWSLDIWGDEKRECGFINRRLEAASEGISDPELISVFARYGIYLFVSASARAELPLNLQGKWNHDIYPKWNSDYHLNINLQMCYWFSDALGLDDYTRTMTDYILSLVPEARKAAERLYGCRGVVMLLTSDIWRKVTPESYNYAVWISGAPWLMTHLWKNYLHTGDRAYLRDYAFPLFRDVALFYEDYVVFDDDGTAQIMPSQSPENKFQGGGYFPVTISKSSAMDVQVAYVALDIAVRSAKILGLDEKLYAPWERILRHLPPFRIGSDGRLLEWDRERVEIEPGHRHVSHLYGVYPESLFTPERNREQWLAARKSLDYRLSHGGAHTGWSAAWCACLHARFLDGRSVDETLMHLLGNLTSSTMLDEHPDHNPVRKRPTVPRDSLGPVGEKPDVIPMIFQIDGNMGAVAAVLESLIQYRNGKLYLLPALPETWRNGDIGPIRIAGGHKVSFSFRDGRITSLEIVLGYEGYLEIEMEDGEKCIEGRPGTAFSIL